MCTNKTPSNPFQIQKIFEKLPWLSQYVDQNRNNISLLVKNGFNDAHGVGFLTRKCNRDAEFGQIYFDSNGGVLEHLTDKRGWSRSIFPFLYMFRDEYHAETPLQILRRLRGEGKIVKYILNVMILHDAVIALTDGLDEYTLYRTPQGFDSLLQNADFAISNSMKNPDTQTKKRNVVKKERKLATSDKHQNNDSDENLFAHFKEKVETYARIIRESESLNERVAARRRYKSYTGKEYCGPEFSRALTK